MLRVIHIWDRSRINTQFIIKAYSFTWRVDAQFRYKAEWTNGNVSWDPQREDFEGFDFFLQMFVDHQSVHVDVEW